MAAIYSHQGAGHSVGLHAAPEAADALALQLGLALPVARVIVNQAHCIATGGSFDNGLPFSLSMGCGTWGGNSFSRISATGISSTSPASHGRSPAQCQC